MDLYNAALECLPDNAKIKLFRGDALYAVRLTPDQREKAVKNLTKNGFLATVEGELLTVTPGRAIIEAEASAPADDGLNDHLYRQLRRLAGRGVCEGEIEVFILSLKSRLYDPAIIENRLRRQAASCMRMGCGGLLHAIRHATIMDKEATI